MLDIISNDQITFVPLRFILDNVLLQNELIQYMKESEQQMILLKLDFKKAYDKVDLDFLFRLMKMMRVPSFLKR